MPRVSEEHLERRRQQILDAAQHLFGTQGFHGTSMQDIFKESGLSAGAVYRYFPSKGQLVRAIAGRNQGLVAGALEKLLASDGPLPPVHEIVGGFARRIEGALGARGALTIAPQGWAAAIYDEDDVGPVVKELFAATRGLWIRVAERLKSEGALPADADTHAVGSALFCIVPGFILQKLLIGDTDSGMLTRGLDALLAKDRHIASHYMEQGSQSLR